MVSSRKALAIRSAKEEQGYVGDLREVHQVLGKGCLSGRRLLRPGPVPLANEGSTDTVRPRGRWRCQSLVCCLHLALSCIAELTVLHEQPHVLNVVDPVLTADVLPVQVTATECGQ